MITRISDSEKSHTLPPNLDKGALETGTMEGIFNRVPRDWIQHVDRKIEPCLCLSVIINTET